MFCTKNTNRKKKKFLGAKAPPPPPPPFPVFCMQLETHTLNITRLMIQKTSKTNKNAIHDIGEFQSCILSIQKRG